MHSVTLLAAENRKLRTANEKIRKKRQKKKSYVGKGGVLSVAEVQEPQRGVEVEENLSVPVVEEPGQPTRTRAPRTCSICRSLEHTARTCPNRQ
jgi:hypothetical protein